MSLPSSLTVNLKRFQSATNTSVRLTGDRSAYTSATIANFKFPASGVLDLQSVALLGTLHARATTIVATLTTPAFNSCVLRKVELILGGQTVSLSQLNDYGFTYYITRLYTSNKQKNDWLQGGGVEGNVSIACAAANTDYYYPVVIASDFLGFMGSVDSIRYLPLSLLPQMELNVYFHDRSRWSQEANTAVDTTFQWENLRLQFAMYQFENNMLEQMYSQRLSSSPVQVPFQEVKYFEATSTTATANTATFFVNSSSIDYLVALNRPADYDTTVASRLVSHIGQTTAGTAAAPCTALNQLFVNSSPISAFQLGLTDALWNTTMSLGGLGNPLFAPDSGSSGSAMTLTTFQTTYYALFHRMAFPVDDIDGKGWMTGLNTYGQSIPIDYVLASGEASVNKKPVLIVIGKGLLEIGAGKQIAITL